MRASRLRLCRVVESSIAVVIHGADGASPLFPLHKTDFADLLKKPTRRLTRGEQNVGMGYIRGLEVFWAEVKRETSVMKRRAW